MSLLTLCGDIKLTSNFQDDGLEHVSPFGIYVKFRGVLASVYSDLLLPCGLFLVFWVIYMEP